MQTLQGFEHGSIVLRQQAIRNMQPIIRIDADQMRVERSVMNFGQRNAIGHDGLPDGQGQGATSTALNFQYLTNVTGVNATKSEWHFTTMDARIKLKHLYPSI
jgi:hypothetical protein